MDRWKREGLLSANNGLRNQVEHLLDAYERKQGQLAEAYTQREAIQAQANSPDRSVEVTVDSDGVLADLTLSTAALRKTPDDLARLIVDVVRAAAGNVREQHQALTAPVAAEFDDMPELSDIMPEAPSLPGIRAHLRGRQNPQA
ncbi:YbaB/EbfC family nucleoid-associated protein [Nocardia sp. CA2R105]|uniref:YbaB/EbfC family nucleoid-associated protein n=1 Tax=Nocardia coffeae TaxID=2873381 RepID=UPI001CA6E494|nr:YbaB/EbfC family nucleoid-associated protein [Nocardia coffeae]MBY8862068.1 YbaB/EbfC family nucleoid-associated protein [Nocardia coffeae]